MAHILVVNDDPIICRMVCEVLESEGYIVSTVLDGREGLEQLRASPEPLVVLVDFLMLHVSGPDMMRVIGEDADLSARHMYILTGWLNQTSEGTQPMTPENVQKLMKVPPAHPLLMLPLPFALDDLFAVVAEAVQMLSGS